MNAETQPRRRGRPRDASIDDRVLAANAANCSSKWASQRRRSRRSPTAPRCRTRRSIGAGHRGSSSSKPLSLRHLRPLGRRLAILLATCAASSQHCAVHSRPPLSVPHYPRCWLCTKKMSAAARQRCGWQARGGRSSTTCSAPLARSRSTRRSIATMSSISCLARCSSKCLCRRPHEATVADSMQRRCSSDSFSRVARLNRRRRRGSVRRLADRVTHPVSRGWCRVPPPA